MALTKIVATQSGKTAAVIAKAAVKAAEAPKLSIILMTKLSPMNQLCDLKLSSSLKKFH
jgi:hypothetical protein